MSKIIPIDIFIKLFVFLLIILFSNNTISGTLNGNLTLTTKYVSKRGISLTGNNPAIQADLSISTEGGSYLGIWGSNVDMGDVTGEIDIYAGTIFPINNKLDFGLGAFYYYNIGNTNENFSEYFVDVTYSKNFKTRYNYTNDFAGLGMSASLIEISNNFSLMESLSLFVRLSHNDFSEPSILKDFSIIRVAINKKFKSSTLRFAYSNTDSKQFNGRANDNYFVSYTYKW